MSFKPFVFGLSGLAVVFIGNLAADKPVPRKYSNPKGILTEEILCSTVWVESRGSGEDLRYGNELEFRRDGTFKQSEYEGGPPLDGHWKLSNSVVVLTHSPNIVRQARFERDPGAFWCTDKLVIGHRAYGNTYTEDFWTADSIPSEATGTLQGVPVIRLNDDDGFLTEDVSLYKGPGLQHEKAILQKEPTIMAADGKSATLTSTETWSKGRKVRLRARTLAKDALIGHSDHWYYVDTLIVDYEEGGASSAWVFGKHISRRPPVKAK